MTTIVQTLLDRVEEFQYNPAMIQRAVLQTLTDVTNGAIEIVDPTNPFVFSLEAAAVLTAGFMTKCEVNTRRQYPLASQVPEDLYIHMSDEDYIGRFATPSKTKFSLLLNKNEVLNKMVLDVTTGIKKLVIPRNTFFTVANVNFSLQYPIEIRQLAHGGLQIVYDASLPSPLQELTTNIVEWELRTNIVDGVLTEWISFEFDVQQFNIISQLGNLNAATDFRLGITISDQFYYARVYAGETDGSWTEIKTTHTDQIYDFNAPTAVIKVVDKVVSISIPQIYTSAQLLNKSVRIDLYETKGLLNMVLGDYNAIDISATWKAYDKADETIFSAPLSTMQQILPYSNSVVAGGTNAIDFETLRSRVITNSVGPISNPITPNRTKVALESEGYSIFNNIDNITNRIFLASKPMPIPRDERLITAAAASIETISISAQEAIQLPSVINNGESITITPMTIYQNVNGLIKLVHGDQVTQLLALNAEKRAAAITGANYLYTPFHYVLDMANNGFESRPYYLDGPEVKTKLFVGENDTTLLQVSTDTYGIFRDDTGYYLQVATKSSDEYKTLTDDESFAQLAYVPEGERDLAYLMGTLLGRTTEGERVYRFDLATTFNVNVDDNIALRRFVLYTDDERITYAPLLTTFDLFYATSKVMDTQWAPNAIDATLGRFILPSRIAGITHEKLRVQFGLSLNNLWSRARSIVSAAPYETWEVDVPLLYEKDVYALDTTTGTAFSFDDEGNPIFTLLHARNTPVLDNLSHPLFKHRVGDVKLDINNNPIPVGGAGMLRQFDAMLVEGAYWFATDGAAIGYRSDLVKSVVSWVTEDLNRISLELLEQTRIYFYPKTTLGFINVMILNGIIKSIPAGQSFNVDLYVKGEVYDNDELRKKLTAITVKTISEVLTLPTISISTMETRLREQYGNDVIDVNAAGLGGSSNLRTVTIVNDTDRCSIQKRLVAQADDTLIVQEDVTVNFIRHELLT